jgi:hypothetical protein
MPRCGDPVLYPDDITPLELKIYESSVQLIKAVNPEKLNWLFVCALEKWEGFSRAHEAMMERRIHNIDKMISFVESLRND